MQPLQRSLRLWTRCWLSKAAIAATDRRMLARTPKQRRQEEPWRGDEDARVPPLRQTQSIYGVTRYLAASYSWLRRCPQLDGLWRKGRRRRALCCPVSAVMLPLFI